MPVTVALTVWSPASPQLTPVTRVTLAPAASVPRLQVTFVVGNIVWVQPVGRVIADHDSSMSITSETPSAAAARRWRRPRCSGCCRTRPPARTRRRCRPRGRRPRGPAWDRPWWSARHDVVAVAAGDVMALVAGEGVVAGAATEGVVAIPARQGVVAGATAEHVMPFAADRASLPSPPSRRSWPFSPWRLSLPAPPSRTSWPSPPRRMSSPPRPRSRSLPPLPQMTSRPAVPVRVSLRSVPRIVQDGDAAAAELEMRRAAATAARGSSRGLISVRAMPL